MKKDIKKISKEKKIVVRGDRLVVGGKVLYWNGRNGGKVLYWNDQEIAEAVLKKIYREKMFNIMDY